MAKIGILTFHRSNNTGAFIQCYAFTNKLKRDFPDHAIEIIDYCTNRTILNYSWRIKDYLFVTNWNSSKKVLVKIAMWMKNILRLIVYPHILKDRKQENELFEADRKYLLLSKERLISEKVDDFNEFIKNKYDIVIVGSDCVWQYINYPFPNAYLLNGQVTKVKMSYAACAYKLNLDDMSRGNIKYLKDSLSSFDYLGVRDVETERVLDQLSLTWEHNCDPSFLLDLEELPVDIRVLKEKLKKMGVDFSRKIIGLQVSYKYIGKWIKNLLNENEYQIVAIRKRNACAEVYLDDISPLEWSRVFSFFYCTVTDFFHGTLLSIMNHTPPIVFDTGFLEKGRESRLSDVMCRMGMQEYYYKIVDNNVPAAWLESVIEKINVANEEIAFDKIISRESRHYQGFRKQLEEYLEKLL